MIAQMGAVSRHHMRPGELAALRSLGVPILVITGDHDLLVPGVNSHELAAALHAPCVVVEDGGHGLVKHCLWNSTVVCRSPLVMCVCVCVCVCCGYCWLATSLLTVE